MKRICLIIFSLLSFSGIAFAADPGATVATEMNMDIFPNPVFNSSFRVAAACKGAVAPCDWSAPATWTAARTPGLNDQVIVDGNVEIRDVNAVALAIGIYPGGTLNFKTDANTKLLTGDVMVFSGGTLNVGTPAQPIANAFNAEIVIRDIPIDFTLDPKQYLRTITSIEGTVRMCGRTISPTFIRMTSEAPSGTPTLQLTSSALAAGWRPGDTVAIPNSEQCDQPGDANPRCKEGINTKHTEERIISPISPNGLTLTVPALSFNHPGAKDADGRMAYLPHVVNLTRNILIRSENPAGTRGHMLFTIRADVDIRYASILSM